MFLLFFFVFISSLSGDLRRSDATLLELENALLDATSKFATANPYNNSYLCNNIQVASDNCILNRPSDGRAVMCNYKSDDVVTQNNIDEHNVVHLQSKGSSVSALAASSAPCSNVKYLNLANNKCRNIHTCKSNAIKESPATFDVTSIVIVNTAPSSNSKLNIF
jgi:hypothetical protein